METQPPGWGVDLGPQMRPGVPREHEPQPAPGAHVDHAPQRPRSKVLKRPELDRLTTVFGDTLPPRGVSGALRRLAYRMPDHKARHWLTLVFADRVDSLEHRLRARGGMMAAGMAAMASMWFARKVWRKGGVVPAGRLWRQRRRR